MTALCMLDADIVSALAREPFGSAAKHIASVGVDAVGVGIIAAAESRYGCAKKGSRKLIARIEAILGALRALAPDAPADAKHGGIRAELGAAGRTIGPNDLLIAAHARAAGAVLVTANEREFERVRGSRVENWLGDRTSNNACRSEDRGFGLQR